MHSLKQVIFRPILPFWLRKSRTNLLYISYGEVIIMFLLLINSRPISNPYFKLCDIYSSFKFLPYQLLIGLTYFLTQTHVHNVNQFLLKYVLAKLLVCPSPRTLHDSTPMTNSCILKCTRCRYVPTVISSDHHSDEATTTNPLTNTKISA